MIIKEPCYPPVAFVYNECKVRVAENDYSLDQESLDSVDIHLTYQTKLSGISSEGDRLCKDEFIERLMNSNEDLKDRIGTWEIIESRIHSMCYDIISAATSQYNMEVEIPTGVKSVAMYGFDVMLDRDGYPYLLECSFSPDTSSLCNLNPNFWNDVFSLLFCNEIPKTENKIIKTW